MANKKPENAIIVDNDRAISARVADAVLHTCVHLKSEGRGDEEVRDRYALSLADALQLSKLARHDFLRAAGCTPQLVG